MDFSSGGPYGSSGFSLGWIVIAVMVAAAVALVAKAGILHQMMAPRPSSEEEGSAKEGQTAQAAGAAAAAAAVEVDGRALTDKVAQRFDLEMFRE